MFKKNNYKNLIFDLDGTLADTAPDIINCINLSYSEIQRYEAIKIDNSVIGPPVKTIAKQITPDINDKELEKFTATFRLCYDSSAFLKTKLYPDIGRVLCLLEKSNYKMFIVTNKPLLSTTKILEKLKIIQYFTGIYTPDNFGETSKGKIVSALLNDYKLSAEETIIVGDLTTDIIAGKDNNIQTVAVTYGYGDKESLILEKPEYIINKFKELEAILK